MSHKARSRWYTIDTPNLIPDERPIVLPTLISSALAFSPQHYLLPCSLLLRPAASSETTGKLICPSGRDPNDFLEVDITHFCRKTGYGRSVFPL